MGPDRPTPWHRTRFRAKPTMTNSADKQNLFNRVWDLHAVRTLTSGQTQLLIGLHLIHEVTSPQAFSLLRDRGLKVLPLICRPGRFRMASPSR
jgi:hypothetical protein